MRRASLPQRSQKETIPMYTILVSAVGGVMGYGVIHSLRKCRFPVKVIGMDIYPDAVGQYWADHFEVAERTDSPTYRQFLQRMVSKYQVDLLIPCIEQDVS